MICQYTKTSDIIASQKVGVRQNLQPNNVLFLESRKVLTVAQAAGNLYCISREEFIKTLAP